LICRILFILLLICPILIIGQPRQYSTSDKQAIRFYTLAGKSISNRLYDDAIQHLKGALNADSNFLEAHNQLADLSRLKEDFNSASYHYQKVIDVNPAFNRAVYLNLGDVLVSTGQYAAAKNSLQKYLGYDNITPDFRRYANKLVSDCDFAIQAMANPVAYKPINVGQEINTENDEYLPVVTADEKMLIFTRKIENNEDFYLSIKKDDHLWGNATYLSKQINTDNYNEGAQSISQDGQYLFFTGCNRPDGLGRCDIFISTMNGSDWGKPKNLGAPINTSGWESQPSISADGRTLYFVSNRKGGYGGYDIWKSTITDRGWSEPENLGPHINTPYDEQSPFIHPDDQTLYFSSNGWPGIGNKDIFISRISEKGLWLKPENLGYPINSSGDENGLTLTANGNFAFFSSNKLNGSGGFDIYQFEMPVNLRPNIVTYVKGNIKNAQTHTAIEADVEIIDLNLGTSVYKNTSSIDSGNFMAPLVLGKNYGLNISKPGYLFYSDNFSLEGHEVAKPFIINVELQPVEIGNKVVLKNIFFETNEYDLKEESKSELAKLMEFLVQNTAIAIEVSGHTDNTGNEKLNQTLSENRAKTVYNYLIKNGINPLRLSFKGFGQNQPIATNATEEGRKQNRRTEFKITRK
jgi:outer membrane protein OmpA-like peptidoglycan-associated protein/tetratricopeptide (TPR) repeat protein